MKVKDCMRGEVISITPETSTKKAFALMKTHGVRHLPVLKFGIIFGMVTDRDLRRPKVSDMFESWDEFYRISEKIRVDGIMVSPVITVDPEADIREAAKLMVEHKIGALPVTDANEELKGILTETDVLKALIETP